MKNQIAQLILEDGTLYEGYAFGTHRSSEGEVVFNTGMVGYPECLTDPSYRGQILVLTYPIIGNYGVPFENRENLLEDRFESGKIQVSGLVVSSYADENSRVDSAFSFSEWLRQQGIVALHGIDTRALTQKLREQGTMLGKVRINGENGDTSFWDPNEEDLVGQVTTPGVMEFKSAVNSLGKRILLVDCGVKRGIIRSLVRRGVDVILVPCTHDFSEYEQDFNGIVISNGPGNPEKNVHTIRIIKKALKQKIPVFGICLGNQILALAAGGSTYKLKYGHRSANQPVQSCFDTQAFITSQNHGYAVKCDSLPAGYHTWFKNLNDGTNEGIIHEKYPFFSVQFHPEASPGPEESGILFDQFIDSLNGNTGFRPGD